MPEPGWPPGHWSLRLRVTVFVTVVVAAVLSVGAVGSYMALKNSLSQKLHEDSAPAMADMLRAADREDPGLLRTDQPNYQLLQILDRSGRVVASSRLLIGKGPVPVRRLPADGRVVNGFTDVPGIRERVYLTSRWTDTPHGSRLVHVGVTLPGIGTVRDVFGALLAAIVPLIAVLVAAVAWLAMGRALSPVRRMRDELAEIRGRNPEQRVTVPDTGDEVAELAVSVNASLRRVQNVLKRQRDYVADLSHELRSPLTGMRAQLEVALEEPADEDWPTVARSALKEAERLSRLVADLLLMAKLDAGVPLQREPVDLGALATAEALRRTRRIPVEVDVQPGVRVLATESALVQVMTNLLDNAERHAGTRIEVTVGRDGDDAVLAIADDGSGIPEQDRERVFQRFERLAESRARDRGGSGLGLAICREIATVHGGTLTATDGGLCPVPDAPTGARLELRLPLYIPTALPHHVDQDPGLSR